jgi:hypothetical protein
MNAVAATLFPQPALCVRWPKSRRVSMWKPVDVHQLRFVAASRTVFLRHRAGNTKLQNPSHSGSRFEVKVALQPTTAAAALTGKPMKPTL